jgi:hypothetical protein
VVRGFSDHSERSGLDDKPNGYGADNHGVRHPSVVRRTAMSDHSIVLAVASYRSKAAAERDFDAVWSATHERGRDDVAAAVLEKGADGTLTVDRHHNSAEDVASGDALLGAALTVVAGPLGILILAPVVATRADRAGAVARVAHFWHNIPRDELFRMSNLLEASQAALVIVAVDHITEEIRALLSNATTTIITDRTVADFEADSSNTAGEANAAG